MKNKKICWIHHHFTHVYQKSHTWCIVSGIRSETDIILCHIGQFFALLPTHPPPNDHKNHNFEKKCLEILSFYTYMCTTNEDHMIYGSWYIRCDRQKFSLFWPIIYPFSPLTTWKIKILTLKKTPGDIIILHISTINDNHMMYGSWDIECNRQNFFVILDHFLLFYPPNNLKNQNFEKWKNHLEILSFFTGVT